MHTRLDGETKSIIEQTLRRFLAEAYEPNARRTRLAAAAVDYRLNWPTLAELGVLGLPFEEDLGGLGGSAVDLADALRVLAGGLILEPVAEAAVVAGGVLRAGADAARREQAVAELLSGESITVLVGGRCGLPDTFKAAKAGADWRLSGRARVVPYAAQADGWLVAAADGGGAPLIFRLHHQPSGARVESYRLMDGRPAADVAFEALAVPGEALWLAGDAARAALAQASLAAVNAGCADAVGAMESLLAITGEYLKTRVQFGAALASFQALQHRYADMHMAWRESLAISRALAASLDAGDAAEQLWLRYAASSVVRRAGRLIGHEAIQMHGGMGVSDELIVSHFNARLVVLGSVLETWVEREVALPA